MITDNGSPWGDGPGSPYTPLGVLLIEQGMRGQPFAALPSADDGQGRALPPQPEGRGAERRAVRRSRRRRTAPVEHWREVYNTQRPHEALELAVPASRYEPSPRDYGEKIEPFEYAPGDIVRRVQEGGYVSLHGRAIKVPKAFRGKSVAFRPTTQDGVYDVDYRTQMIATVDITSLATAEPKVSTMSPNTR